MVRQPVRQPGQPDDPLRHHRPGDLGADRGPGHALRRGHGHRRHDHAGRAGTSSRRAREVVGADPATSVTTVATAARTSWRRGPLPGANHRRELAALLPPGRRRPDRGGRGPRVDPTTRGLARRGGLLVGASSGLAVAAALQLASRARTRAHRGGDPARLRARLPLQVPLGPTGAAHGFPRRRPARAAPGAVGSVHTVTTATPLGGSGRARRGSRRDQPMIPVVLPGRRTRAAPPPSRRSSACSTRRPRGRQAAQAGSGSTPVGELAGSPPVAVGSGRRPAAEALARLEGARTDTRCCCATAGSRAW